MVKQRSAPCINHKNKPVRNRNKYKRFQCLKCGWWRYPNTIEQFSFDLKADGRPRGEKKYIFETEQDDY